MKQRMYVMAALLGVFGALGCGGGDDEEASAQPAAAAAEPAAPPPEAQVCNGEDHVCIMKPTGEVFCAGGNIDGELGNSTGTDSQTWTPVVGLADAVDIACGSHHTCAARRGGQVSCWGRSDKRQLGNDSTDPVYAPVAVAGLADAVEVAAGKGFSCARRRTGAVSCWGDGEAGQLGRGTRDASGTPADVMGLTDAVEIVAGMTHACARKGDGAVVCWGEGSSGQLGQGDAARRASPTAVAVPGVTGATAIGAGANHTCAATATNVQCWGYNRYGQLGNDQNERPDPQREGSTTNYFASPVVAVGLTGVTQLALETNSTCALKSDGAVSCWGYNNYTANLLGRDSREEMLKTPGDVTVLNGVAFLAAGYQNHCAIRREGQLVCWGQQGHGQFGRGNINSGHTNEIVAPAVTGITGEAPSIAELPASAGRPTNTAPRLAMSQGHACGVKADGSVFCFGNGGSGQLGNGSSRAVPASAFASTMVRGITDAVDVAINNNQTCVVRHTGGVACFGALRGNLRSSFPVPVEGVTDAVEIALGVGHACVRQRTGTVQCWGQGNSGQLGNGANASSESPVAVQGVENAVQIVARNATSCARLEGGKVMCWGSGSYGTLGNDGTGSSNVPVEVEGLSGAVDVDMDYYMACAATGRGTSCWGRNDSGQLGNGNASREEQANKPVAVRGPRNTVGVALGGGTACAVARDGEAMCWGENGWAQTGHDTDEPDPVTRPWAVNRSADEAVAALPPYLDMVCSTTWCCGVHRDGHMSCSGSSPIGGSSGFFGLSEQRSQHPVLVSAVQWPVPPTE